MRSLFWLAVTAFTMSPGSGAQQAAPSRAQQPKPAKAETAASKPTPKTAKMLADPPSKAPAAAAAKTREARKPVPIPEEPKP